MGATQFILNVSVVIFNDNNQILLGLRSPHEDVFPNKWGIPGGKIDDSDPTLEAGLSREVDEEMGIKLKNFQLVSNNMRTKDDGTHVVFMIYSAEIESGTPTPKEDTVETRWFNFDEIVSDDLTPYTYGTIKNAYEKRISS